jgi:hypothetical protein
MILLTEAAEGKGDIGKRRILAIAGKFYIAVKIRRPALNCSF